ncbi:MAG TPA: hypothetical protein VNJ07_09815, partial [Chitinophagales bacterium]|nr:hypothetical protein [Chitinophagales bacterium]
APAIQLQIDLLALHRKGLQFKRVAESIQHCFFLLMIAFGILPAFSSKRNMNSSVFSSILTSSKCCRISSGTSMDAIVWVSSCFMFWHGKLTQHLKMGLSQQVPPPDITLNYPVC